MAYEETARLCGWIARDFSLAMFRLLINYDGLSASQAASRLGLHVQTCQDFLEGLHALGVLKRETVREGRRPHFHYRLVRSSLTLNLDLSHLREDGTDGAERRIRERKNSGVRFKTARDGASIAEVIIWEGSGRARRERRIHLTRDQGRFLFHLPFPSGEAVSVSDIADQAGVDPGRMGEIRDIVDMLLERRVIEIPR